MKRFDVVLLVDDSPVWVSGVVAVSADGSEYVPFVDSVRWSPVGHEYGPAVLKPATLREAEDALCQEAHESGAFPLVAPFVIGEVA